MRTGAGAGAGYFYIDICPYVFGKEIPPLDTLAT